MAHALETFGTERLASICAARLTAITVAQASVLRLLTAPAPPEYGPRWAMPSAVVLHPDPRRLTASLSGHASHHP
jgi:nitrate/nitrite transporter NarK